MNKIRKLKTWSFAKFQSILFGLLGLAAGIIYSFGGFLVDLFVSLGWVVTDETPGLSHGTILAFGALVGMPIIFACVGFILGIIEVLLFNFFSKWFGGIDIDFNN